MKNKKLIFISSRQIELQTERDQLREFINSKDSFLSKYFSAQTFEKDLAGRKKPVLTLVEDWVLKSNIYLGIFDKEYSEPTEKEYNLAIQDKQVPKEFIICVRIRGQSEKDSRLRTFLDKIMNPDTGHSCILYNSLEDLQKQVKHALTNYINRMSETFILSKETLGPNLEGAKNTNFSEKLRRKLLQPLGRFMVLKGRFGIPEYYMYDYNGTKIDITLDSIEPKAPNHVKEFYRNRFRKSFD